MMSMLGSYPVKNYLLGDCAPKSESVITAAAKRMSVTVITGFLGSGKNTLLNHIVNNAQGLKVAVLVDQFDDIELEAQRVISDQSDRIELSNGCICHTVSESLVETVSQVIAHDAQVDYLVIKTDKLAEPSSIMTTFMDPALKKITRLDAVLGVVNAETFDLALLKNAVYVNQLIYSDVIILNTFHFLGTDRISADKISAIEQDIHLLKSGAQILSCDLHCSSHLPASHLPLSALLNVGLAESESGILSESSLLEKEFSEKEPSEKEPSEKEFSDYAVSDYSVSDYWMSDYLVSAHLVSVPFCSDRPFDFTKFEYFLRQQLPKNIFRAKGTLWFKDQPHRYIFWLAGNQSSLFPDTYTPPIQNKLVFIGHKLNPLQLCQQLGNCLTGQPVSLLNA